MAIKKIGFDFDKVFVDYPPIIPNSVINFCYRHGMIPFYRNTSKLSYRIPGPLESKIRLIAHVQSLRPPIIDNVNALKKIHNKKLYKLYLISGRFGFLEKKTNGLLDDYDLRKYFEKVNFNFKNSQPHMFKEKIIREEKISVFIDDDIEILKYLSKKIPKVKYFWLTNDSGTYSKNITMIPDLGVFYNKYLKRN